jgi:MFS family permease
VVDRIGARKILLAGLVLGGGALMMLGLHLSYSWLIACAALLGLANSVYHPADYAILSAHMDEARMGRAFSIHTFAGFLGGAMAPSLTATLVAIGGGRGALILAGATALLVALLLLVIGIPDASTDVHKADGPQAPKVDIITPTILVLTVFFMLLSLSNAGIGNFGVVALMSGYGSSFSAANVALTGFLGAGAAGVLAGGMLADRTRRHGEMAAACFALNAGIVLIIATMNLPPVLLTLAMAAAGFLGGVIAPSRDMLVRNAAPPGAAGRAFGIVSTGFNAGGIISPLLFGWIMDQNSPHWVFGASAVFMALTVLLALVTERNADQGNVEARR